MLASPAQLSQVYQIIDHQLFLIIPEFTTQINPQSNCLLGGYALDAQQFADQDRNAHRAKTEQCAHFSGI